MATYDYRRKVTRENLLPAIGAGVGAGVAVGLAAGYIVNQLLRREKMPAAPESAPLPARRP